MMLKEVDGDVTEEREVEDEVEVYLLRTILLNSTQNQFCVHHRGWFTNSILSTIYTVQKARPVLVRILFTLD